MKCASNLLSSLVLFWYLEYIYNNILHSCILCKFFTRIKKEQQVRNMVFKLKLIKTLSFIQVSSIFGVWTWQVTNEERRGAEIDYLKRFGADWLKSGGNQDPSQDSPNQEFLTQHPRFQHFVKGTVLTGIPIYINF